MTDPFAQVLVARGPRAAERALAAEVERLRPRLPGPLAPPLRIVVPSASLRLHVARALVAHANRPLVGVVVQTLSAAAREVLDRGGARPAVGDAPVELLVRRLARLEPVLADELDSLEDGCGVAVGGVRDLLDAGFQTAHLEALADKLASLDGVVAPRRLERVAALARLTVRVAGELQALGVWPLHRLPELATDLLRSRGRGLLPARAVLIHGFADATGIATDFLEALLAVLGGTLLLDRPPDPAAPDTEDVGAAFLERIEGRFGGLERRRTADGEPPACLHAFSAAAPDDEIREVAGRTRELLDAGLEPEAIAVVAREVEPIASSVRRHFDRLGIPYSGVAATVPGGAGWRRARQLARLLGAGGDLPAELWVETLGDPRSTADLLAALRTLGVARTSEVAALVVGGDLELPMPAVAEDEEPATARRLAAATLDEAVGWARRLVRQLEAWPEPAPAAEHLQHTLAVIDALGWVRDDPEVGPALDALREVAGELPEGWACGRDEWTGEAQRRLERTGESPLGGAGGGVQVMSAMAARARTFEQLFLVRLNRGVFPRVIQDDALLPDAVRGHLAVELLREFPVKARGLDEERYLFAQLVAAAPVVTLSWCLAIDGQRAAPSPFVERLQRELGLEVDARVRALAVASGGADRTRPAFEHALLAADPDRRDRLAQPLALARDEGLRRAGLPSAGGDGWAQARLAVLDEIEKPAAAGPGPWAGLVGPGVWPGGSPAVTRIEELARCPWQSLAVRRLGLAPMPDPRHGLPDPGPAVVGQLVHRVLQRIVDEALDRGELTLDEARVLEPTPVPWPERDLLEGMIEEEAGRVARAAGLAGFGIAPLLAAQAWSHLDVARAVEWAADGVLGSVLAAEVSGGLEVAGVEGVVRFRADRVDRGAHGVALVDYKIGAPPSDAQGAETRHDAFLQRVASGRSLQAVAYALAGGAGAIGRYLHLRPEVKGPVEAREVAVDAADAEAAAAFATAVTVVVEATAAGTLFPRVEEPDGSEPRFCAFCPVRQACLRDDSGFRRRLVAWMAGRDRRRARWVKAARALWWLGVERPEDAR